MDTEAHLPSELIAEIVSFFNSGHCRAYLPLSKRTYSIVKQRWIEELTAKVDDVMRHDIKWFLKKYK